MRQIWKNAADSICVRRMTHGEWMRRTSRLKARIDTCTPAVDSLGKTLDFLLTAHRDATAAKRFLCKALKAGHNQEPRVINVDTVDKGVGCPDPNNLKNAAYPKAINELKEKKQRSLEVELRQNKYLNNIVYLSGMISRKSLDITTEYTESFFISSYLGVDIQKGSPFCPI